MAGKIASDAAARLQRLEDYALVVGPGEIDELAAMAAPLAGKTIKPPFTIWGTHRAFLYHPNPL